MDWLPLSAPWLWAITIASIVMFVGTLMAIPMIVIRIPADYFVRPEKSLSEYPARERTLRFLCLLARNLLGLVFVTLGVIMLVTPGQGVITILIGLSLMSIPGKRRLLEAVVFRPKILSWINETRAKSGRPPLEAPSR